MADGDALTRLTQLVGATANLSHNLYPQLVRFRDIRDPRTVEAVNPGDLASTFGPGIKLRRLTIQITNDPVVFGIRRKLVWLGEFPEPALAKDPSPTDYSLAATLRHGDFKRKSDGYESRLVFTYSRNGLLLHRHGLWSLSPADRAKKRECVLRPAAHQR